MSSKYRYGYKPAKNRHVLWIIAPVFLVVGAASFFVYSDLKSGKSGEVQGVSNTVSQLVDEGSKKTIINEQLFSMQLPVDWKEKSRVNNQNEKSITYQATKKNFDNRYLTVYIDVLPKTLPVNRLLPVSVQGEKLAPGDVSDNCASFTGGGSLDAARAAQTAPKEAKWSGVDFICNLPGFVDNQVGVGAPGEPINQVTIKGPGGSRKYFFLYTDRNIQPDYTILKDALTSFQSK